LLEEVIDRSEQGFQLIDSVGKNVASEAIAY
jgi:hypothetical protein